MDLLTNPALDIAPPIEYLSTNKRSGVLVRATVATHERLEIPETWFDCYWTVQAKTSDVSILFGDDGVEAALAQASSVTSEVITLAATSGFTLIAGALYTFRVKKVFNSNNVNIVTHFSHIAADANGYLNIYISQNR
jgi:hypothetical protein